MVEFILVALGAAAAGFVVWAVDRNRASYGVLLMPAAAVVAAVLLRVVLLSAGVGFGTGPGFLTWLLPAAAAIVAAAAAAWFIGRRRAAADLARLTAILR
ncbi:hypothetical protein [Arthrobacter mobilis]|uniref:Uncharacterized protein n=1 Tax=Arthrobacter mobilis TaxID=2724944 RepID=A0A7X6HB25_9MICC|nr:hypothetical protein [Arthrobacter mobilis]NKX53772.1 hypothetical protein [Arthrobacter mobilis]